MVERWELRRPDGTVLFALAVPPEASFVLPEMAWRIRGPRQWFRDGEPFSVVFHDEVADDAP